MILQATNQIPTMNAPPQVTVTIHEKQILLTIAKHPVRGITHQEWLERQCFEVLGKDEMVWCGSRWRKRVAEEPEKLERVLSDMRVCRNEGKHIYNPGGYAEDLWKRFV